VLGDPIIIFGSIMKIGRISKGTRNPGTNLGTELGLATVITGKSGGVGCAFGCIDGTK
jgi:hypothetical protein